MACRNAPINLFFLLEKAEEKVVHNRYPILIGEYGNIISLFLIKSWCTSRKNLLPVYLNAKKMQFWQKRVLFCSSCADRSGAIKAINCKRARGSYFILFCGLIIDRSNKKKEKVMN